MSDRRNGEPTASTGTVQFDGLFRPEERRFLAAQFSRCRFRLLARSVFDERLALVQWLGSPGAMTGSGPNPLFAPPRRATYVLDAGGQRVRAGRPPPRDELVLERIDDEADLRARYAGHFPEARVEGHWWDRLGHILRGHLPALMLAALCLWLLAVAWACGVFR